MLRTVFGNICILFAIGNLSSAFVCCELYKVLFQQECRKLYGYAEEKCINSYMYNCLMTPVETASYQQFVSQFHFDFFNARDRKVLMDCIHKINTNNANLKYVEHLVEDCHLRIESLTLNTNESTELSHFNAVSQQVPYITTLNIRMFNKCYRVNSVAPQFKYLEMLEVNIFNSVDLNECEDFSFKGTKLTKLYIYLNKPSILKYPKYANYSFDPTFLSDMENLKEFKLNCGLKDFEVQLPIEMFQGLSNLEVLALESCVFNNLSVDHFQNLTTLRVLNLSYVQFDDFDWLSSDTLAKHVRVLNIEYISTKADKTFLDNVKYFEKYENLNILAVDPPFHITDSKKSRFPTFCMGHFCELFIDRDGTKCPDNCRCIYLVPGNELYVDCRGTEVVAQLKALPKSDFGPLSLYLFNSNLTKWINSSIVGYSSIEQIDVNGNQLDDLHISNLPENLTFLDLCKNDLTFLRPEVLEYFKKRNGSLQIRLSNNPWTCDCDNLEFLQFLNSFQNMIEDYKYVECDGMTPALKLDECRLRIIKLTITIAILSVTACVIVCVIIFWFRVSILMWLYDHNIFVNCILRTAENIEFHKKFDAFLAFSHKNLDLIPEYVEKLENGRRKFKLCFYHRDWLIGESIPACILQSIDDSKRIIVLMTKEFVKSSWGTFEFRTAIRATSMNRQKRLIIIVYPEVENFDDLDLELRLYLKFNTYLKKDDGDFWRKLIYAMPHKKMSK